MYLGELGHPEEAQDLEHDDDARAPATTLLLYLVS